MTLTREQLLEKIQPRYEEVPVSGFGTVGIRSITEVKRILRSGQLFTADGQLDKDEQSKRRVFAIIDQVMIDEDTPMFRESDAEMLAGMDSTKMDSLYMAVQQFNGGEEDDDGGKPE